MTTICDKFCLHCQNQIPTNLSGDFCCAGCEMAYAIINKIGLGNYYKMRVVDLQTRKIKPEISEEINISEFVANENGINSIHLAIDGMHCAACVWLIESILQKQDAVVLARVNLSKKYLHLKWRGDAEYGNKLVLLIHEIGYKLFPFDEKILAEEEKKYNQELLKCLAVAGFGAGNVMLFSSILWFSDLKAMGSVIVDFMHFFSALIALPVIIYAARPFFYSAFKALKAKSLNMDLSISVAIFLACVVSLIESFRSADIVYFDSAVMLIFFLLIGRYLDFRARKRAFAIATEFSLLSASFARLIEDNGNIKIIASKDIKQGMNLLVVAGDKIPADAIILEGESEIDTAIITGETLPRAVLRDSELFAGTINISAPLKIKVTKSPDKSLLKDIIKIVEEVETQKNKYVRIADRLARLYTPMVHGLALFTFALWYFFFKETFEVGLMNATAVLIITCPCALALAVPIVQTITISSLIKRGILAKSGEALEQINEIDAMVFDKTGTLTIGRPTLVDVIGLNKELNAEEKKFYLKLAASLAQKSRHPIATALTNAWDGERFNLEVKEEQGLGLSAKYFDDEVRLGRSTFAFVKTTHNLSTTNSFLKYKNTEVLFTFQDRLKADAINVIAQLKQQNKKIILLSGDNKNIVEKVAQELGISEFKAEQTPLQKVEFLRELKKSQKIMMVGDGLNDAPSLAIADVSISFAKAADISQTAADVIVQGENLTPILYLFNLSKRSIYLIRQNLILALIYNLFALPFAIMGYVTPLIAAIAMSSSSILVLLNSLRINK